MIKILFLSAMFLLMAAVPAAAQEQKTKDVLFIAIQKDLQPFTFLNAEGKPAGLFVDIWRLWAQKTGKKIEFISSDWKTSFENLNNRKVDIHSGLLFSPERSEYLSGSPSFIEVGVGLFYRVSQGKISNIKELSGETVAAIRNGQPEQYLKQNYPDIQILSCDTREELVKTSREGKSKGFIAMLPVGTHVIDSMGVSGEFETYDKTLYREKFHPAVHKDNKEILALVNKGFDAISKKELAEIEARWIPDPTKRYYKSSNIIPLTPAEEKWLKSHKTIRVGMSPVFPPLKFSENGVIKGIEPDYLFLLAEYSGIQFEYVIADFSVMDAKVKAGEMDMFISFNIPERLSYMSFTQPFMDFKQLIVARSDTPYMSGIGALKGKKMAAVKGVKLYEKLLAPYPEIEAVPVATMEEMFKAVSESRADALITKTYYAGYVMQDYPNLKIVGVADLPPEPYLYAIRKDYPELVAILNKAISAIPKERSDAIIQKWSRMRIEYRANWHEIIEWAAIIGGAIFLILGLTIFWNRRLRREIDRRRQYEEALQDERRMFIGGPTVIFKWVAEKGWPVEYVSPNVFVQFGYTVEDFMSRKILFTDIVHPDDLVRIAEENRKYSKSDIHSFEQEYRIKRADGESRWLYDFTVIMKNHNGEITHFQGYVQDITDRKRAENALRESENRYRTLTDFLPISLFEVDTEGNLISYNRTALEVFRYHAEDYQAGMNALQFFPPDEWQRVGENLGKVIRGASTPGQEFTFIRKDKTTFSGLIYSSPIIRDSKPVGIRGAIINITDRKRAEEELRESEERYRTIIESIEEGYFELDIAGNFTFFNDSVCRMLGYNRSELMGMNDRDYTDRKNSKMLFQVANMVYKTGIPATSFAYEVISKDEATLHIESSMSLTRNASGQPTGFRGIMRNITERKRAEFDKRDMEDRLQRAEKMESLGTLAGGVAHDLNNVLGIIVGYSELILDGVNESNPIKPHLVNIMNGGLKAAAIVEDLLTLARRGVQGREVLNLNHAVSECRHSPELAKLLSHHPSVKIETSLEPDLLNISGSSVHLVKSLYNLISNASEAMPKGGTATIRTANQYLDKPVHGYDHMHAGDYVVLSVSDTGEGISEKDLKRIFEPFYTKKIMGRSGTGLGLAVVWGTVKDHNGYINVESEEGKGSTFTLYFPVTREDITTAIAAIPTSEYMGKGESILVVDDVKEQRDLAASILTNLNYYVMSRSSGEEAVEYLKGHKADLIVLDMIMDPGMDGLDTYRQALEIRKNQKAIIVSGFSESDRVKEARSLGAGAYLKKPYIKERLGIAVRRELDNIEDEPTLSRDSNAEYERAR